MKPTTTTKIDDDTLAKLSRDMALYAAVHGAAPAWRVQKWVARLNRLTKRPDGVVPVMMEGGHVLAYGELKDGH